MELTATVVPLAVASVVTFVLTALPLKLVIIISFTGSTLLKYMIFFLSGPLVFL